MKFERIRLRRCVQVGIPLGIALAWGLAVRMETFAVDTHDDHDPSAHADAAQDESNSAEAYEGEGLRLTEEQRERFGIEIETAGAGSLHNEVRLQGEVVFNEDRLAHMVPRVAGIAREVHKSVGDPVRTGEVLAVIDSAELASAKLDYFAAATELGCCQFDLPRAQAIHDNALGMMVLLESSPSVEQLQEAAPGEMGDYRGRLISAYAEYVLTRKAYEREKTLLEMEISSEGDYLAAESAFKKAQAQYYGTRDSVSFEVRQNLLAATRDRQLAEFQAETAQQKLLMLGLSQSQVARLGAVAPSPGNSGVEAGGCTDPNCTDCAEDAHAGTGDGLPGLALKQADLGWYEIKAPFDGFIVQKHIALGERVGEDFEVFTIVDTLGVWVNLTVYTKDLSAIRKGQEVVLRADHSGARARGEISMVTPFVEESTRSATARVALDNSDGRWMPGTFVTGLISNSKVDVPVVVSRDAVQNIEDRDVVFVEHDGAFEMRAVTLGRTDRAGVEVLAGLEPGMRYVSEGAFQLKATVVTSNLSSHAGHGH